MKTASRLAGTTCKGVAAFTLTALFSGCTIVGPDAIRSGRLAYNEAITETNNQQMLMVLVHNRYEETHSLLAVSSVTANVSVSSRAQVDAGFGDSENYAGNLIPFRGGFVYEENPTISYSPVSGEAYLRQLMSPVPLSLFVQITQVMPHPELAYDMLLASLNGIRNPAFLYGSQRDDPRFDRVVAIMTELTHQHSLHWARDAGEADGVSLIVDTTMAETAALADDFLALLGLPAAVPRGDQLAIPVSLAWDSVEPDGIGLITRTTWELVEILSASVQVPTEHEQNGQARDETR